MLPVGLVSSRPQGGWGGVERGVGVERVVGWREGVGGVERVGAGGEGVGGGEGGGWPLAYRQTIRGIYRVSS